MSQLRCPICGTTYDVSQYAPGYRFTCTCGNELEVPAASAAPPMGTPPPVGYAAPDTGMQPGIKVLVFFGNLCFSPLAALISTIFYFVIKDKQPQTARDLCQMTWIPFVIAIVLWTLYFVFFIGLAAMGSLGHNL